MHSMAGGDAQIVTMMVCQWSLIFKRFAHFGRDDVMQSTGRKGPFKCE